MSLKYTSTQKTGYKEVECMTNLCNDIISEARIHVDLKSIILVPLFKGKIMTRCNVAHSIVVETRVRSQASAD